MTKMKNTKKGMAKKALSISLVAAMLATSNVPVWAAFEADDATPIVVEAPVAETPVADEGSVVIEEEGTEALVSNIGDITTSIQLSKKEVEWGTPVTVSGSIINKTTGADLDKWSYGWRVAGTVEAVNNGYGENITSVSAMNYTPDATVAGKDLELYIFRKDTDYDIDPTVIATLKVNAKQLTADNTEIKLKSGANLTYNGFTQNAADQVETVTCDNIDITDKVTVTSSEVKNAGDTYTVTVTSKDPAYSGSVEKTGNKVSTKTYASGDIIAKLNNNLTYEYTGESIKLKSSDLSLTESKSENNGADGKLGGADLSSAIKSVETVNTDVGTTKATVTVDASKLTNFSGVASTVTTENDLTITARDLSKTTVKIGTNNEVSIEDTTAKVKEKIVFYDGTTKLALKDSDYTVAFKNSDGSEAKNFSKEGNYTAVITHEGDNTKNSVTVSFRAEGNVISSAEGLKFNDKKYDYTGKAISPSKSDIGTLTVKGSKGEVTLNDDEWSIVGYGSNTDVTVDADGNVQKAAYVTVKVLAGTYKDKTVNLYFTIEPLEVKADYITVPKTVVKDSKITKAEDYKLPVTVVAKNADGKVALTLSSSDYTVKYAYVNDADGNKVGNKIKTTVTVTNKNFKNGQLTVEVEADTQTEITDPVIQSSFIKVNPSSYTYTGGTIKPSFVVMNGDLELEEGVDYEVVSITNAVNVGTGTIKIKGLAQGGYSGEATADFTITKASVDDIKVTVEDQSYEGKKVRPTKADMTITLNGNDVSSQFEISAYGDNNKVGTDAGIVTLKLINDSNFTGSTKTVTFNIVAEKVVGTLKVYNSTGKDVTSDYDYDGTGTGSFTYDGKEKTFASVKLTGLTKKDGTTTKATADDFEIKYVDNIYGKPVAGKDNVAFVYVVAKEGANYSGTKEITTADGTVIKNIVDYVAFRIKSPEFTKSNVTVKNGVYASGLPVKPQVIIQYGGNTLVEDVDYELVYDSHVDVTTTKPYTVTVKGKGGYAGIPEIKMENSWGIDKFNYANAEITVKDGVPTVKNGNIIVSEKDYDVKDNGDGTITISAKENSKNYTGSQTVKKVGDILAVPTVTASVDRNMVDVNVTSIEGAIAYDYVLCQSAADLEEENYFKSKMSVDGTSTQFQFVREGQYYVYARAAKRDDNGKKIVSDWSVAAVINVTCDTPNAPTVTKVTTKGNTVTVTYTTGARTEGVDVIIGGAVRKQLEDDAMRPVNYNSKTGLIKNVPATTKTVTFTNVAKGTYFVGVHPYITSNDGLKYFGRWSKQTGITKVVVG